MKSVRSELLVFVPKKDTIDWYLYGRVRSNIAVHVSEHRYGIFAYYVI